MKAFVFKFWLALIYIWRYARDLVGYAWDMAPVWLRILLVVIAVLIFFGLCYLVLWALTVYGLNHWGPV